jgi:Mrp family chromosome partitioning ATPase
VLLVDASLYSPSVHQTFSATLSPGLAEKLLSATSNGMRESEIPDLHILTGGDVTKVGPKKGNLTRESAVFDRFARDLPRLLHDWRQEHRYVVLDLPSLAEESQVPHVASQCDGVLLVVAAEQGRWQSLRNAREQLEARKVKLLGVVLNKRRYPIPTWLYRTL